MNEALLLFSSTPCYPLFSPSERSPLQRVINHRYLLMDGLQSSGHAQSKGHRWKRENREREDYFIVTLFSSCTVNITTSLSSLFGGLLWFTIIRENRLSFAPFRHTILGYTFLPPDSSKELSSLFWPEMSSRTSSLLPTSKSSLMIPPTALWSSAYLWVSVCIDWVISLSLPLRSS